MQAIMGVLMGVLMGVFLVLLCMEMGYKTTGRWKKNINTYITALTSNKVSPSVGILRGNRPLELPHRRDVFTLFGETKAQAVTGLATNLSKILDVKFGPKGDPSPST